MRNPKEKPTELAGWFDHAYVINLDRRPDRLRLANLELEKIGLSFGTFIERWRAFDCPENGNAGCTRSHRDLISQIAQGPYERVLVFEDDFKLLTISDFIENDFFDATQPPALESAPLPVQIFASVRGTFVERLSQILRDVPTDWDVLYLGGGYAAPPISRVSRHCIRNAGMLTTSSYAITKSFARVWTERVDACCNRGGYPGPIDHLFCSMACDHCFYTIQPRLFIQRAGYSDLNERNNSYLNSMTDSSHEMMV